MSTCEDTRRYAGGEEVHAIPCTCSPDLAADYERLTRALQINAEDKYKDDADLDDLDERDADLMDAALVLLHRFAEAAGIEPRPVTYEFITDEVK